MVFHAIVARLEFLNEEWLKNMQLHMYVVTAFGDTAGTVRPPIRYNNNILNDQKIQHKSDWFQYINYKWRLERNLRQKVCWKYDIFHLIGAKIHAQNYSKTSKISIRYARVQDTLA